MKVEEIEIQVFDSAKLKGMIEGVEKLIPRLKYTLADLRKIDEWVKDYFKDKAGQIEVLLTRCFVLGVLLGDESFVPKGLPEVQSSLLNQYQEAVNYIKVNGGLAVQGATVQTAHRVCQIVADGLYNKQSPREIANRLHEDIKEESTIGRYWQRVSVTETSAAINNGFLATKKEGDFVIGVGYYDACELCKKYIVGRVYRINKPPTESFDNLDPLSKEYKALQDYWDKYIWIGKTNFDRSPYENKKLSDGTKAVRLSHEMYAPALPLHPNDRCRWENFNPRLFYVDKNGQKVLKTPQNEPQYKEWYQKNIVDVYGSI